MRMNALSVLPRRVSVLTFAVLCGATGGVARAGEAGAPRRIPVIYCSDLLHPHDDPDDHFDLATLFALPELDVKAILLDLGERQRQRPGRVPVEQMLALTGRRVPYATGLSRALGSPYDRGASQLPEDQGAIELLLKTLRESRAPVIVITTGSERDICAAFNREPELLRRKIARLYVNTGNLDGKDEWNVKLDRWAYIGLMRSGLPIYWCPCMPAGQNRTTHWKFKQAKVLETAPPELLNFFIYALQQVDPDEIDPRKALAMDLRPWRRLVMAMERNMWSTSSLLDAAGRRIYRSGDGWVVAAAPPAGEQPIDIFNFIPVRVEIDDQAGTRLVEGGEPNMHLYKVMDAKQHEAALESCLRELLSRFPLSVKTATPR